MKKKLVLINWCFPYLNGEPYIENEIGFYASFDEVLIIPFRSSGNRRNITTLPNTKVIRFNKQIMGEKIYKKLFYLFPYIFKVLFDKLFWEELKLINHKYKSFIVRIKLYKKMLFMMTYSEWYVSFVKKQLTSSEQANCKYVFYGFWLIETAYIAVLLKRAFPQSKAVCRAHAGDIYENVFENQYNPFRNFLFKNLDLIYASSEDGKAYLEKNYPGILAPIIVSRLGTMDHGCNSEFPNVKPLKIVSCSRVHYLKRIDKLIYALSEIKNRKIEWTHIEDGPDYEKIKELSNQFLPDNIIVNFTGALTYNELIEYYKNNDFNIFINVSAIEGIPVSIMEALSFGIPVIATDVGASSEVVIDHYNGFLLKKDFSNEDLCERVIQISDMSEEQYRELRCNSRYYWETHYSAEKNYPDFMQSLLNLVS